MEHRVGELLQVAVRALAGFKQEFGSDLTPSLLAELYVALQFDLVDKSGKRYQVKQRDPSTLNVGVNNFQLTIWCW